MLIEAGENYWDILTYAEPETQESTKPSESADGRYAYFDNKDSVFSQIPYMTNGTFAGYEAVAGGGVMTFSNVTSDMLVAYGDVLESNGIMFNGATPDGMTSYYVSDRVIVTLIYDGSNMKLQAVVQ